MARIETSAITTAPPEDAWKLVGDLGGISEWASIIETSSIDGTRRDCTMPGGGQLVEEITSYDDDQMRYTYRMVEAPFEFTRYEASFAVTAEGDGSKVTWTIVIEPDELEPLFVKAGQGMVNDVKAALEG